MERVRLAYFFYNVVLALFSVIIAPVLLLRGWRRGIAPRSLPQRLGYLPDSLLETDSGGIWLHAVSVGEVLSCPPLIAGLREAFPETPILVSTTTASGHDMAIHKLAGTVDGVFYAPLDLSFAVRKVLRGLRPQLVLVMETEIWPNLFRQVKRHGCGLLLVNGRMSDRSAPRYAQFAWWFRRVLRYPDRIFVQSELDQRRFITAGAPPKKVSVGGNLKYDFEPGDAQTPADLAKWIRGLNADPIVLAGSTREGEEAHVIEAFRELLLERPRAALIVAPRHPQRFDEAATTLQQGKIPLVRRTALPSSTVDGPPCILLVDSLGELASLYRLADIVFVGGSLNGWGGHNVLEPAFAAKPVIVGPTTQNFRAIVDTMRGEDALVEIAGSNELGAALVRLSIEPAEAQQTGVRAKDVAQRQRGAVARVVEAARQVASDSVPRRPIGRLSWLVLGPLALLWRFGADLHRRIYASGLRRRGRLRTFTVCVGNLTVGGVGKTPAVGWLATQLARRGLQVGVLLRGYRATAPGEREVLRSTHPVSPLRTGDEAHVLFRRFERAGLNVPVGIGSDRRFVGELLQAEDHVDVLLLDDGFQHHRLERDYDLVLLDATNPFGGGYCVPLGRLRESVGGLRRASAVLLTRTEPGRRYEGLRRAIARRNPGVPVFESRTRVEAVHCASEGEPVSTAHLADGKAIAFCGLGNPAAFWRTLGKLKIQVAERIEFRDHHAYTPADVRNLRLALEHFGAQYFITTEKDLVNLWQAADHASRSVRELEQVAAELFAPWPLRWLQITVDVENGSQLVDDIADAVRGAA